MVEVVEKVEAIQEVVVPGDASGGHDVEVQTEAVVVAAAEQGRKAGGAAAREESVRAGDGDAGTGNPAGPLTGVWEESLRGLLGVTGGDGAMIVWGLSDTEIAERFRPRHSAPCPRFSTFLPARSVHSRMPALAQLRGVCPAAVALHALAAVPVRRRRSDGAARPPVPAPRLWRQM